MGIISDNILSRNNDSISTEGWNCGSAEQQISNTKGCHIKHILHNTVAWSLNEATERGNATICIKGTTFTSAAIYCARTLTQNQFLSFTKHWFENVWCTLQNNKMQPFYRKISNNTWVKLEWCKYLILRTSKSDTVKSQVAGANSVLLTRDSETCHTLLPNANGLLVLNVLFMMRNWGTFA